MNNNNSSSTKSYSGRENIVLILFSGILLSGAWSYYSWNIPVLIICAVMLAATLYYSFKNNLCESSIKDQARLEIFMTAAAVLLLLSRLYRIFSFPADFYSDEWTDIVDLKMKMNGEIPLLSYNVRSGASIPLVPHTVYAVLLVFFREHIEFLRVVPFILVALTSAALYFLGLIVKGRRLGIVMLFLYAASGWAIFTSRELLGNMFLPFLAVLFLLLFFLYAAKKDKWVFVGLWVVFLAGFFTYPAWALMVPYAGYLIFEYRKELGMRVVKYSTLLTAALAVLAAIFYLANFSTVSWSAGLTIFGGSGPAADIFSNIINIPVFFIRPLQAAFFTDKLPLLSFVELLLLAGGIFTCLKSIKDRSGRVFLAGFCIALLSLVISSGIGHQARHILLLPFIVILSSLFLENLVQKRFSTFIVVLMPLFFIGAYFYMLVDWNSQLNVDNKDIAIARYIDSNYRDKDTIFMYATVPYGDYSAFYHSRLSQEKIASENVKRVVFVSPSLLRGVIKSIFPGVIMRYFCDYSGADIPATVLYELDLSREPALRDYFIDMNNRLTYVNTLMWAMKYDEAIRAADEFCEYTGDNPLAMLKNTFLRYQQLKALEVQKKGDEMGAVLLNREKPMFITSEWYLKLAEAFFASGDRKNAVAAVKTAVQLAPEWKPPAKILAGFGSSAQK